MFVFICVILCIFFFFQAEDGIRDVERSRGLGDVYKRQVLGFQKYCNFVAKQKSGFWIKVNIIHLKEYFRSLDLQCVLEKPDSFALKYLLFYSGLMNNSNNPYTSVHISYSI
eukprot:TRINITY_DN59317_c0_g1_i2.p1 TRINITY_DN59317_c0_g1~~TRINITY_DN59317_c0_g1_i2.p1  ORF type:complete len:112 (+),score=21.68 TRINITY_DN59317_c0_g1_i2:55-390(+)